MCVCTDAPTGFGGPLCHLDPATCQCSRVQLLRRHLGMCCWQQLLRGCGVTTPCAHLTSARLMPMPAGSQAGSSRATMTRSQASPATCMLCALRCWQAAAIDQSLTSLLVALTKGDSGHHDIQPPLAPVTLHLHTRSRHTAAAHTFKQPPSTTCRGHLPAQGALCKQPLL